MQKKIAMPSPFPFYPFHPHHKSILLVRHILALYNALNGTHYDNPEDIEI